MRTLGLLVTASVWLGALTPADVDNGSSASVKGHEFGAIHVTGSLDTESGCCRTSSKLRAPIAGSS